MLRVEVDRPAPGEELNTSGDETVPRQAASVIVLRGGAERLELLLVQRTPHARFMGGFWVFPGGAVDAHEGEGDASHRLAAVRELEEEAGIAGISPEGLVKFSQWITPRQIAIRFDTHFFLAAVADDTVVVIDGDEIVGQDWFTPAARPRGPRARRARPRLPDDQAPRAALAVRIGGRADRLRLGARGAPRRAARDPRGRDRPRRPPR